MTLTEAQQREIIELRNAFTSDNDTNVVLISCTKSKLQQPAPVNSLYKSSTFSKAKSVCNSLGAKYFIVSAKYGLLSPQCIISPYNVSISDLTDDEKEEWAQGIAGAIMCACPDVKTVWFFASRHYSTPIANALKRRRVSVKSPLAGLPIGKMNGWLLAAQRSIERPKTMAEFYQGMETLAERSGLPTLSQLLQSSNIPQQGVYFFFDPAEQSHFSTKLPRLVRVGTHGVSEGSKSTLRARLRNHLGTKTGDGNHRGSVFRLHVGAALIQKHGLGSTYPEWGKGQHASYETRSAESELEHQVSEYISNLRVLHIEVADMSSRRSSRSVIEQSSIGLFTENFDIIDPPSATWLGRWSPKLTIQRTGLWNLQHVGSSPEVAGLKLLSGIVSNPASLI